MDMDLSKITDPVQLDLLEQQEHDQVTLKYTTYRTTLTEQRSVPFAERNWMEEAAQQLQHIVDVGITIPKEKSYLHFMKVGGIGANIGFDAKGALYFRVNDAELKRIHKIIEGESKFISMARLIGTHENRLKKSVKVDKLGVVSSTYQSKSRATHYQINWWFPKGWTEWTNAQLIEAVVLGFKSTFYPACREMINEIAIT